MRGWRWLAVLVMVATLLAPSLAAPVRAQYATGLPNGVVALEVDGQPVDAANIPETGSPTPQINGRVNTGQPSIGIGIGAENGDVLRFVLEVDQKGRFKGQPPDPLAAGRYALYLDDVLAGNFAVTGEGGDAERDRDRKRASTADLARAVPVPADFGGLYLGLGLLNGRYYSLEEEAVRSAAGSGDLSDENVAGVRQQLRAAGWMQRYESRLASPDPENPERFALQVTTFIIEYETPEQAFAAFQTSVTGNDLRPDIAVGEISELAALTGTTPDTGVEYQGLRNLFLQGRFVGAVILADLLGGTPDQDAVLAVSQQVAFRAAALEGGVPGASPRALRLNLPADAIVTLDEVYEAVDGAIVPLYNEDERGRAARETMFAGTYEDFVGEASGTTGAGTRDRSRDGTPTPDAAGRDFRFAYGSTVMLFPTPEDADGWLAALPERIGNDPLRGYADFQPEADAPSFGDASSTWAVRRESPDGPLDGYRVYLRVGPDIAALEYATSQAPELADLQPLIDAQLACLQEGACPADGSLPARGDRERERDGAAAATPEASGPGVSIVDGGAPAAETPEPVPAAETPEPAAEPAQPADSGAQTPEPAIRRGGSATETPEPQPAQDPAPAPTEEPAEPAPSGGGVRIITPEPEVTGG